MPYSMTMFSDEVDRFPIPKVGDVFVVIDVTHFVSDTIVVDLKPCEPPPNIAENWASVNRAGTDKAGAVDDEIR